MNPNPYTTRTRRLAAAVLLSLTLPVLDVACQGSTVRGELPSQVAVVEVQHRAEPARCVEGAAP